MSIRIDSNIEGMISCAQFDYTGRRLAVISSDQSIRLYAYNDNTLSEICTLENHPGEVLCLSWSHPKYGSLLASCGSDRKIIIWREQSIRLWQTIYDYTDSVAVNCVSFAPWELGLKLLAGMDDGNVMIISFKGEWVSRKFVGHSCSVKALAWGTAISLVSACNSSVQKTLRFVTGDSDGKIKYWTQEDESYNSENLEKHTNCIRDISWNPIISSNKELFASCADRSVVIWYRNTEEQTWKAKDVITFSAPVWKVSWNALGNALAVSSADNITRILTENLEENWRVTRQILQKGEISEIPS